MTRKRSLLLKKRSAGCLHQWSSAGTVCGTFWSETLLTALRILLRQTGEMAPKVRDQAPAVIGGMITAKTVKTTRTNSLMAFITLEDLYGTVEVIVFPRDYDKNRSVIEEDRKKGVLIKGRVTVEEDKPAKLICSEILPFDELDKRSVDPV